MTENKKWDSYSSTLRSLRMTFLSCHLERKREISSFIFKRRFEGVCPPIKRAYIVVFCKRRFQVLNEEIITGSSSPHNDNVIWDRHGFLAKPSPWQVVWYSFIKKEWRPGEGTSWPPRRCEFWYNRGSRGKLLCRHPLWCFGGSSGGESGIRTHGRILVPHSLSRRVP